MTFFRRRAASVAMMAFVVCGLTVARAQSGTDWPNPGRDQGSNKHTPLTQVTPANVTQLKQAWTYDLGPVTGGRGYSVTPIVVGNVMYFPKGGSTIVALNATTGVEMWTSDLTKVVEGAGSGGRGFSYWPGTAQVPARLIIGSPNGYLIQLDAKTGAPVPAPAGLINLSTGIMDKFGGNFTVGMPPAIYRNTAIVAGRTGESGRYGIPGDPRAFDLMTGKELWRFHVVPHAGEENFGTWGLNGWQDRRGPGVWVPITVDQANDLVFFPLGNATDQNYGGSRPGENLYATSLLVLRASTGKRVWHFQFTHHDIYDWDVNSPPSLIEAYKNGQRVPAVAQMTKQGLLFMFDRMTGEPLFGVEERPVPMFDAPGDSAWPTQPFPVKPVPFTRDSMTRDEIAKISPEGEKYCTELFDKAVNSGPYTPYGMTPSLVFPGSEGGGGMGGVTTDPAQDILVVNTRHLGVIAQLSASTSSGVLPSFGKSKIPTTFYTDPNGYPCNAPPWAELVGISTKTADILWKTPLGEYKELTARGITGTGTVGLSGGPITTASGLIFIGSTTDGHFRAFETKTGKELWKVELPNNVYVTPISYQGTNGKQFVTAVAGGGDQAFVIPARPAANAAIVAFTLP